MQSKQAFCAGCAPEGEGANHARATKRVLAGQLLEIDGNDAAARIVGSCKKAVQGVHLAEAPDEELLNVVDGEPSLITGDSSDVCAGEQGILPRVGRMRHDTCAALGTGIALGTMCTAVSCAKVPWGLFGVKPDCGGALGG